MIPEPKREPLPEQDVMEDLLYEDLELRCKRHEELPRGIPLIKLARNYFYIGITDAGEVVRNMARRYKPQLLEMGYHLHEQGHLV